MAHLAAVIPAPRAPIEVKEVETCQPGPHELLVKNELIALHPVDGKMFKHAIFPLQYPAVLGSSFGGTVVAVGPQVTGFQIGDKVAAYKFGSSGNKYGAFQRFVLSRDATTSKIPEGVSVSAAGSLIGNLTTVVGLFSGSLRVDKPNVNGPKPTNHKKVLIYGGTSSVGSLSVQYVAQAGYTVVTTTSPRHADFVSKLGAARVIDHTQDHEAVVKALIADGPYDIVVDAVSQPGTIKATAEVLSAQGGGKLYALLPAYNPDDIPQGVTHEFASWPLSLAEERNASLKSWAFQTYLPLGLVSGKVLPLPTETVSGGLEGLNRALDILEKGVSGLKLVVNPWE